MWKAIGIPVAAGLFGVVAGVTLGRTVLASQDTKAAKQAAKQQAGNAQRAAA